MENNIKVPITKVTVLLIYNDETYEITNYNLVGSYDIINAEKFLLSENCEIDFTNVNTLKVIEVFKDVVDYVELCNSKDIITSWESLKEYYNDKEGVY